MKRSPGQSGPCYNGGWYSNAKLHAVGSATTDRILGKSEAFILCRALLASMHYKDCPVFKPRTL